MYSIYSSGTKGISLDDDKNQEQGRSTFDFTALNIITDVFWASSINSTSNAKSGSENLLDNALERLAQTLKSHLSSNFNDLVKRDISAVLDIFFLLAISRRLFECADDKRRCGGYNGNLGLSILDGEFDGNSKTFPVSCRLNMSTL